MAKRQRIGGMLAAMGVLLCSASGCELLPAALDDEPEGKADGSLCKEDDECRSGTCTSESLCAHSACECPGNTCGPSGKEVDPCAQDWVCTDADSVFDGVEEFFGGHARKDKGYCQPRCQPACPEHYYCRGELCVPQVGWADPVPTIAWSGAAEGMETGRDAQVDLELGKAVTLKASASSPTGEPIRSYSWMRVTSQSQERVEGDTLELTIAPGTSYARAELSVIDERNRVSLMTVTFQGCFGAGSTCGYQGSGCCQGCDRDTNLCM